MHHQRVYVGGCLRPGTALVVVCLAVVTLPPSSTTSTVAGCRLVGCSVVIGRPLCSCAVEGVSLHVCVCLGPVLASHAPSPPAAAAAAWRGREEEEEEEDLFVFNDTVEGPRAPAVKPGHITQA